MQFGGYRVYTENIILYVYATGGKHCLNIVNFFYAILFKMYKMINMMIRG